MRVVAVVRFSEREVHMALMVDGHVTVRGLTYGQCELGEGTRVQPTYGPRAGSVARTEVRWA
jgi:hypothetical protein